MTISENKTDALFKEINFNSDCRAIAQYIVQKFANYDIEKAKKTALNLMKNQKYSKEAILNGEADEIIAKMAYIQLIEDNSVRKKDEQILEIKLKSKKESISGIDMKNLIAIILGLSITVTALGIAYNNKMNEALMSNVGHKIEMLTSDVSLPDNRYSFNELSANKIISLCINDPNLFDVAIYNAYYNNATNRINNITKVWDFLQNKLANDDAFSPIYAKMANKTFLDYVLNMLIETGKVEISSKEYEKYVEVIKDYNNNLSFEKVDRTRRRDLVEMMEKYKELGLSLYKSSKNKINEIVETQSTGGRK